MADIELEWTKTEPISIREYGNYCGFDLSLINILQLPTDRRKWIEKEIVTSILEELDEAWEEDEWETPLYDVKKGVYVITLSGNICIEYTQKPSQVIYIGRGQIRNRIRKHLINWVTHFSESLQDIKFHFWMTEIKVPGSSNAFIEVEADLIKVFEKRYGEYPILNYKSGNSNDKNHNYDNASRNIDRVRHAPAA